METMRALAAALLCLLLTTALAAQDEPTAPGAPLTVDAINAADLSTIGAEYKPATESDAPVPRTADAAIVRLQVLLDRAGASPGVIDGFDGDNVRKAVLAFELMQGLPADGILDAEVIALLDTGGEVFGQYQIVQRDLDVIGPPIPRDYAEQAQMDFLGYSSIEEQIAERFHMHVDLLSALNPDASYAAGEHVLVAAYGPDRTGEVTRIEADKTLRQVRAYDAEGRLIAAYPATIGSEDNPSPTGSHVVEVVAPMPNYTYNPKVNFQQGDNTEVLVIPPGPNGPVGSMWIGLSAPTYGIHGTPEPALIDKTGSHGCVRLTNWDANELAEMVKPGVVVDFLD
jgi:lipoprotein-anchoring transpeptidase ErfK/SrfK